MSERERLVELLLESEPIKERDLDDDWGDNEISDITEHLLENGVIVLPIKIGDKVYRISFTRVTRMKYIQETTISRVAIDYDGLWLFCSCNPIAKCKFGKLVFLTKEQAEKALKGGVE